MPHALARNHQYFGSFEMIVMTLVAMASAAVSSPSAQPGCAAQAGGRAIVCGAPAAAPSAKRVADATPTVTRVCNPHPGKDVACAAHRARDLDARRLAANVPAGHAAH
jgi:hypothetical protein